LRQLVSDITAAYRRVLGDKGKEVH
jgi:hypothetical protein